MEELKLVSIKPSNSIEPETTQPDLYERVCKDRFNKLEQVDKEQSALIREIHSKIHNGFGDRIKSTNDKVIELKSDTIRYMNELKDDIDRRFNKTDQSIRSMQKSSTAMLITVVSSVIGAIVFEIISK